MRPGEPAAGGRARAPVVGVVGCGRMGTALAEALAAQRRPVLLASRGGRSASGLAKRLPDARAATLERVAREADIVALASPLDAVHAEIAPRIRAHVAGKPIIDMSNPCGHDLLGHGSAAELVARLLPGGAVVKALNCVSARQLAGVARDGLSLTVPIAGDDPRAKQAVRSIIEPAGLDVADAGGLPASRWIEALARLLMRLEKQPGLGDAVGFRLLRLTACESTWTTP
ncbi:putative dinucleotide-binding enzyme [Actinomadura coerulea]|uniref:Putative dinucleotide-binding enzyme n=1 Tax=Actinomadura coerulea TaxID=46159 RepID=A0A7X0FVU4_9ACTN|nr:NAD(P)-binding domain-containing protein [Actinomadura coerulea]MBB6394644.1 putative dinucleotide-binding enzyme [Actinomadura coerulea]GGQ36670.1 NADP oxidoreductase [Actinomadura coerulea]